MLKKLGKILHLQAPEIEDCTIHGWGIALVWVYFLSWAAIVVFLYIQWNDLSSWIKYPLAVIEAMVVPDMTIFRDMFGIKQKGVN
jgi:Flp pilus assembly protein TadB